MTGQAQGHGESVGVDAGKGAVNDGGERDHRSGRARSLLLRYWSETGGGSTPRLRGTIRDLSGSRQGAFETETGLFALLRRFLAADACPPDACLPDASRRDPNEAERTDPEEPT